ncbi:6-carboxytetrahydropterin synthase [Salinisphaera sp. T31B1]|uniref:6-carboxytetrahydropterin synthase n=1 Tax=Salinisphaera sp. T31B1 TaxID=727963 RepID=UPI003342CBA4
MSGEPLTLFVDHVTHIDCGVLDPDTGLGGRTWLVDAELTGRRDDSGMLFDFGPAKRLLKREIDALLDHRLLVPARASGLTCHGNGNGLSFVCRAGNRLDYAGPPSGMAAIDAEHIDSAGLTAWLTPRVAAALPAHIDRLRLTLRPERIDGASYHYCHGLKNHDGDCQRMGHGHRCRLAVEMDGRDRPDLARSWADRWQGVFIGQREDRVDIAPDGRQHFAYSAPQGRFSMRLAAERCVLLDGPPTVENIADHIAGELAAAHPGHALRVRAYEGVGKGAIATRG